MKIFLTGATGSAGAPVLRALLRKKHDVTALVRKRTRLPCKSITGSLGECEPRKLKRALASADAIVHLANTRSSTADTVALGDILGTWDLVKEWPRGPFVFTSSQTVYGVPDKVMVEDLPPVASCWYDVGKIANEQQLQMCSSDVVGKVGISLRMALLFGAGERRGSQFLAPIVAHCRKGGTFVFASDQALAADGSSFIGEDDFATAVVRSLSIERSGVYNLAGGFCTWRELVLAIDRAFGSKSRCVVRKGPPRPGELSFPRSRSVLACDRFVDATGFRPRQDLDEVIALLARAEGR